MAVTRNKGWFAGDGPEPVRAHDDDAGFDLFVHLDHIVTIEPEQYTELPAGVAIEWPMGMWGFLVGRSSSFKRGLMVNPAIIDAGFRGELFAIVRNISDKSVEVHPGDRIAQIIPMWNYADRMTLDRVGQLSQTRRGSNGFGSTGR